MIDVDPMFGLYALLRFNPNATLEIDTPDGKSYLVTIKRLEQRITNRVRSMCLSPQDPHMQRRVDAPASTKSPTQQALAR